MISPSRRFWFAVVPKTLKHVPFNGNPGHFYKKMSAGASRKYLEDENKLKIFRFSKPQK